ncbi:MAG: PIN domain-containing protein [Melioribacteraceae bacterium]|nr:PIN domain-containing protein [Melioribacteraceae bacterium]MCF8264780.1 PIN domain-containing protein [Melioribacteraceae bacterium]MCF8413709.1 PIN domain-containing protein [Melioribacteraceae bacterium]
MIGNKEYLIETDVLIDHIEHETEGESKLEELMKSGKCFTTVINSAEIYFSVKSVHEKESVDKLMYAIKVIGMHSRYSLMVGEFSDKVTNVRDALILTIAKSSKLSIVTFNKDRYRESGLEILVL